MNKTLGILFLLRKSKENKKTGESPIYLRLTVDGQRSEMSINRTINSSRWNPEAGRASGSNENSKALNAFIDSIRAKVYQHQRKLIESDMEVTASTLMNSLKGIDEKAKTILEIMEAHNQQMYELIGKDYALGTYKRFETTKEHLKAFIKYNYKLNDLNIKSINHQFITEMEHYLKAIKGIGNNSTVKYISNFKKIVLIAHSNGWIEKDPFLNYKGKVNEVEKYFLSNDEINLLIDKPILMERIDVVRDIFIFSCFTGLAYVDAAKLCKDNIIKGIDGEDWIEIHRTKTKVKCRIPLLPESKRILDKYKENSYCINKKRLLPMLSNQKMNAYLKEVGDICGIKKNLTFHIARHTFATTVTLSNNVPLESVSKMMGHTNTIMTQKYAKILDKKVSDDIALLRVRLKASNGV